MIKINLLTAERKVTKKRAAIFGSAQQMTLACAAILAAGVLFIGWRYMVVQHDDAKLNDDIAAAQKETVRLHSVIVQVEAFEQRKIQLQQRVALIEQLRAEQTGPVHMLDQISRALPPMVWLVEVKQTAGSNEVFIDGRATTITSVSDFVVGLEASGYFKKSVEIVSSTLQTAQTTTPANQGPPVELVAFQLKALFQQPGVGKQVTGAAPPIATAAPKSGN
jgi:type IV pilus assembly protein PilN